MRKIRFFLAVALPPCLLSRAVAADDEIARASLKGLHGVQVLVERLDPLVEAGLTTGDIQTDVELKLRLAGIPVLSKQEMLATPGQPYLYVNVNVNSSATRDLWPDHIEIQLNQNVTLARSPEPLVVGATTWSTGSVGAVFKQNLRSLRDGVKDQVDRFINAYLAVNPKK
jgi:hypothetical protein